MPAPAQIAHYKITGKLGEGGMGAVYRATDTKLNREVAIKLLPDALDADRVARFAREAQVLAALNHPNIATIYGVEDRAIIMELVDGKPLQGPVDEDTAMGLITQLIDALEYAHDKAIIHRDLKPANILVTADGRVKVLDFGLAKALAGERVGTGNPETSPTLTMRATEVGLIMGTASYMSPEQARGATVDKRADIWSFGVVLYELLTGKQLFGGDNVSDILADVLKQEVDFARVPARFRKLVTLCLTRDLRQRLRDVSAARHFLDDVVVQQFAAKPSRLPWAVVAGALLLAAGVVAWLWPKPAAPGVGVVRFHLELPDGVQLASQISSASAVPSPDGKYIALLLREKQGPDRLWIRSLADPQIRKLERVEEASTPFWAPDSQSIAYFTQDKLMRVAIASGTVQTICSYRSDPTYEQVNGGAWGEDGSIVYGHGDESLQRVPAAGGLPAPLSKLEKGERAHRYPQFLPGGKQILFLASKQIDADSTIDILDVASEKRTILTRNTTKAVWAPPGFLLFARDGLILAQRLQLNAPVLEGEAMTIAEGPRNIRVNGRSAFMLSPNGVPAYRRTRRGTAASLLAWYDRQGKRGDVFQKEGNPSDPAISPDGKTVAMYQSDTASHLWVTEVASGVATRLSGTQDLSTLDQPIWSRDSKRIIVSRTAEGGMWEFDVGTGTESEVFAGPYAASALAPDGKSMLITDSSGRALFNLTPGPGARPRRISESSDVRSDFRVSPDGRFVAYLSVNDLFVASYPTFDQRRKIASGVGHSPLWSRSGKELYFWDADGTVHAANVKTSPGLDVDAPVSLFRVPNRRPRSGFAVTADGQKFLIPEMRPASNQQEDEGIHVIVNWAADLPK